MKGRKIDMFDMYDLYKQQNELCHYCHHHLPADRIQVDHKIPKSKWWTDNLDNFVLSCKSCNSKKWTRSYEEYMQIIWYYLQWLCTYEDLFEYVLYLKLKSKYE